MAVLAWVLILCISVIMAVSLTGFIRSEQLKTEGKHFSTEIFYTLFIIYIIVLLGFGLIYFVLSMNHVLLVEDGELHGMTITGSLMRSLYFSGVTLLTIGYGDIAPVGIGRVLAIIQALIGYILPTAFVLKVVQTNQKYGKN